MLHHIRFAFRGVSREPGFTLLAVSTLALGIAAATAVFGVVDAVYLRPLPLEGGERLLRLRDATTAPDGGHAAFNTRGRSFRAISEESRSFESLVAITADNATVVGGEAPERVRLVRTTGRPSWGMGVKLALGRDFTDEELRAGEGAVPSVALVSESLFTRVLGGNPNAIGGPLRMDGATVTVIGVLPTGFRYPYDAEVWVPSRMADDQDAAVFARLKPGVSLEAARAELVPIAARLRARHPELAKTYAFEAIFARDDMIENQDRMTLALLALVGFFLLIACADVASLLLARAVRRGTETAIRRALGASRADEIGRLLGEGLVLALFAGLAGLLLSAASARFLAVLVPSDLGEQLGVRPVGLDGRLLGFALGVSCLTAVVAALAPALQRGQLDLTESLRGVGAASAGPRRNRLLSSLVVAQIALASSLLAGAALLGLELRRLQKAELGIDTTGVLTVVTTPPRSRYADAGTLTALVRGIEREVGAVPGVASVGSISINPLWGSRWLRSVVAEGKPGEADSAAGGFLINHRLATPGALPALGIPILSGRGLSRDDTASAPLSVVVSRGLARRLWGDADPVGRRIREFRGTTATPWRTVVGVAGDVKDHGQVKDAWYLPYEQEAATASGRTLNLMVRGTVAPASLTEPVKKAVWRVDRDLSFEDVETMSDGYARSFARERTGAATVTVCAVVGVVLAALGLFGLVSYVTNRRRREIGVRLAVGASRSAVARLVLGGAGRLILTGLALGGALALGISRLLRAIVLDLPALTPGLFASVALLVAVVSILACAVPSYRAARLDPVEALRSE